MSDTQAVEKFGEQYRRLRSEVNKVIIGQDQVVDLVLQGIFSRGHCLLVGVPGLAKTLLVNSVAQALGLSFNRIQFTPDLMPSDIIGSEILDQDRRFRFVRGPIFANVILADEINRTPPKTQAALLEAMQEKSVTAAGATHPLQEPFFVLATQNPIEQEGTYPLPEAQLDRFMFNIWVDYPTFEEEMEVVKATTGDVKASISPVLTSEEILSYQALVRRVPVADNVLEYAVKLATRTRPGVQGAPAIITDHVSWGAGPRASQFLVVGAKCHALAHGRFSPDIADVQAIALPILRHRLVRNYKAEAEGVTVDRIVEGIL
ncbi:MAG: MoxR family ATPase [Flavobacteriales bacterium]|jgi:MoxR-like ATPase|nr:MoxR family ATPase [Flavobacteriales bacterium]MBK6882577.1 MoxR family ATPase [Flavobacteriales bacterium]MBK7101191.1 MoxR family ATPase [Flavobacteriales bacterium]MBK7111912.1 MoxR family ATPase [Flavobacteriales bacterium]MBK7482086.1 MoxR family ATPase [Flavobacteriales bacterium]